MRIDGRLAKWNDDRGFGFIAPAQGGQEIFVHISAFPRDGHRPRLGEALSFEVETTSEGKKRAKSVSRLARSEAPSPRPYRPAPPRQRQRLLGRVLPLVAFLALGTYGYGEYSKRVGMQTAPISAEIAPSASAEPRQASSSHYKCDGRTHCSQMTSCAEATFFLQTCPGVKMDGDRDGVPCEEQWCTGPFSK